MGGPVRTTLKTWAVVLAVGITLTFSAYLLVPGVAFLVLYAGGEDAAAGVAVAAALIGVWCVLAYLGSGVNRWAEVDGDVVREKRLFTRRTVERPVADVVAVRPVQFARLRGQPADSGYKVRFRTGGTLTLDPSGRHDVTGFMRAVKDRLGEDRWAEVVTRTGKSWSVTEGQ